MSVALIGSVNLTEGSAAAHLDTPVSNEFEGIAFCQCNVEPQSASLIHGLCTDAQTVEVMAHHAFAIAIARRPALCGAFFVTRLMTVRCRLLSSGKN